MKMKRLTLFFILILFVFYAVVSCKDSTKSNPMTQKETTVFEKKYFFKQKKSPTLSSSARDFSIQWTSFSQFMEEINSLHGESLAGLQSKSPTLLAISDSLQVNIPDTLNSRIIQARVLVAKTRVQILNQELNKGKPDSTKIKKALHELQLAMDNLIIQINEKIIKSSIDIQRKENEMKELEKQKRFLDSVYQAELTNLSANKQVKQIKTKKQ